MNNHYISKRLSDVEQRVTIAQPGSELKDAYQSWLLANPLSDDSDFNFDSWADGMPKQFIPLFTMSVLTLFPWFKKHYRSD